MKRIELKYKPGSGQIPNPNPNPPSSGSMQKDVPVQFFFKTPTVREGFNPDKSTNGTFFVVAPGDNNASFTGEFAPFPPGTPGTLLGGSGPSSFHWGFKKNFVLEPDTEYTVTVKADADCAGFTGKLNPGY